MPAAVMPAAVLPTPGIDLYRASHQARIDQLWRDVAAREEQLHADLALIGEEFAVALREILARHNPDPVDGQMVPPPHAETEPAMAAEVLFTWGIYGDHWQEVRAEGAREVAVLGERARRAQASLTGPDPVPVPVPEPEAAPDPEPEPESVAPVVPLQLLRRVPDPAAWALTASITLPVP